MSVQLAREPSRQQAEAVVVNPMSIHIGAEISGVDLSRPLPPDQVSAIRAALVRWKVVFFRDQSLDHRKHIALARQFGDTTAGHVVYGSDGEYPQIYSVAKHRKANRFQGQALFRAWSGWHTDITAAINPPAASILRGEVVPPYGGDTQFTNLVAAYNALSPAMQAFVDGLRGVHRFAPPVGRGRDAGVPGADAQAHAGERASDRARAPGKRRARAVREPVVFESIVGLSARESQVVLEFLWEHVVRPEFTVRFRWAPGSVAFWDNRATAHLAPRDIFDSDFDRQFYRVTSSETCRSEWTASRRRRSKASRSSLFDAHLRAQPRWRRHNGIRHRHHVARGSRHRGAAATGCPQEGAGAAAGPGKWRHMRRSASRPVPHHRSGRPRPGRIPASGAPLPPLGARLGGNIADKTPSRRPAARHRGQIPASGAPLPPLGALLVAASTPGVTPS